VPGGKDRSAQSTPAQSDGLGRKKRFGRSSGLAPWPCRLTSRLLVSACGLVLGAVVLAAPASSGLGDGAARVTPVTLRMLDFRFRLSPTRVPVGTVRFRLTNRGASPHDFWIAGRRSRVLGRGRSQTLLVRFRKAGRYRFLCTLPGHARLGMTGALVVSRPPATTPQQPLTPPPPSDDPDPVGSVRATEIGRFDRPVFVTSPPGDARDVYVVEQTGRIRVLRDDVLLPAPFLDIVDEVKAENETGLLSLAFAPDYAASGRFYVYFNDRVGNGNVNVVEYRRSAVNPTQGDRSTARLVLNVEKPWENHNGGMMQFGADGYLFVSIGDGDAGTLNKPGAFAQRRDELLGNILRIDPRSGDPYAVAPSNPFVHEPGVRSEIWAYGLRNPWRFWIDPPTGDLYIGDPGLAGAEEVNWVPGGGQGGWNFGWPCFEGTAPFDRDETCPGDVKPVIEYVVPGKCSVIGGLVVRDPRLPTLIGRYVYTDFCLGVVRSFRIDGGAAADDRALGVTLTSPTSFGEDGAGRVYVTTLDGAVYRLDPASG
jgi:glucose/arabinose dehydrogenase